MSEVVAFAERVRHPGQGGIVAATALGKGAALILGWHRDRLPRRGIASFGEGAARGPFRLTAWAHEEAGLCWFLAALQLQGTFPPPGAGIVLQTQGIPDRPLAAWPGTLEPAREFIDALAQRTAARPGDAALFLADLVEQAPRSSALRGLLRRYLAIASTEDGAVEIIGGHGGMLLFQGWGRREFEAQAVFADGALVRAPLTVAGFARPDIAAPATGLVEAIALAEPWRDAPPQQVHVVADGRLWRRPVVGSPQLLGAAETAGHIADMLPRLSADADALAMLGRAARTPFEGADTLARANVPLAAALDLVVVLPGIGVYVAGWLADPKFGVVSVSLGARCGFLARLDEVWTRIARPDVVAGLAGDGRFAAMAGDTHGFAAFVACDPPAAPEGLHLAIETAGGGVVYLPAQAAPGAPRALLRRIAASIDLHKPTGLAAVEAQLSPLIATAASVDALPDGEIIRAAPPAQRALLLPLLDRSAPPAAHLSAFLRDPPVAGEETLVLVLGPAWHGAPMAELLALAALYGLDPTVVIASEWVGAAEAWELGARATGAALLHCLPPAGHAAPGGWRRALAAALPHGAEGEPVVMVPTLLYEDGSVRSTGFDALIGVATAPYVRFRRPFSGMPRAALASMEGGPRRGAILAGALVTREAHRRGGGFARFGLRTQAQEAAFFLRLGDAGGECRWRAEVSLVAPEARDAGAGWHDAARLADGHALRSLWCGGER